MRFFAVTSGRRRSGGVPVNTNPPTYSEAQFYPGNTMAIDTVGIWDPAPLGYSYQWYSDTISNPVGGDSPNHLVQVADYSIFCIVRAIGADGYTDYTLDPYVGSAGLFAANNSDSGWSFDPMGVHTPLNNNLYINQNPANVLTISTMSITAGTELDLKYMTGLIGFYASGTGTYFSFTNQAWATSLATLDISNGGAFGNLDLSGLPALYTLDCSNCGIDSINQLPSTLYTLDASYNPITSFYPNLPSLVNLDIQYCTSLASLELANSNSLVNLMANHCPFTSNPLGNVNGTTLYISLSGCNMDTAVVDGVLANLDGASGVNGVLDITFNASPTPFAGVVAEPAYATIEFSDSLSYDNHYIIFPGGVLIWFNIFSSVPPDPAEYASYTVNTVVEANNADGDGDIFAAIVLGILTGYNWVDNGSIGNIVSVAYNVQIQIPAGYATPGPFNINTLTAGADEVPPGDNLNYTNLINKGWTVYLPSPPI